jgi:hypothetical protein
MNHGKGRQDRAGVCRDQTGRMQCRQTGRQMERWNKVEALIRSVVTPSAWHRGAVRRVLLWVRV